MPGDDEMIENEEEYGYDDEEEEVDDEEEEGDDEEEEVDDEDEDEDDPLIKNSVWDDDIDDENEETDPEDDDEDIDDEDPTDEDLEDEEERSVLDDLLGQDPNAEEDDDEEEVDEEDPEITDEMIADAAIMESSWQDYIDQAEEDGMDVNDKFVAMMARGRVEPEFLSERGIYNIRDMRSYIDGLEEKVSPDAVLVPRENDLEGWENFDRNILGVPESSDGYSSDIWDKTFLEGNQEKVSMFNEEMHEGRFSNAQAMIVSNMLQRERDEFLRDAEEQEMEYKQSNLERVKETFGSNYGEVKKSVNEFLNKFGTEFKREFRGSKVINSEKFFMMIYDAMNDIEADTTVKFKDTYSKITAISDEKLDKLYNDLLEHKYADEKFQQHKNPGIRKTARSVAKRINTVDKERVRRGLV